MNFTDAIYTMPAECWAALGPDAVHWAALSLLALLCFVAGVVVSSIDPELLEVYVGEPPLLALTAALAVVALATLITIGPSLALGWIAPH